MIGPLDRLWVAKVAAPASATRADLRTPRSLVFGP